jgi:hypothetical protein
MSIDGSSDEGELIGDGRRRSDRRSSSAQKHEHEDQVADNASEESGDDDSQVVGLGGGEDIETLMANVPPLAPSRHVLDSLPFKAKKNKVPISLATGDYFAGLLRLAMPGQVATAPPSAVRTLKKAFKRAEAEIYGANVVDRTFKYESLRAAVRRVDEQVAIAGQISAKLDTTLTAEYAALKADIQMLESARKELEGEERRRATELVKAANTNSLATLVRDSRKRRRTGDDAAHAAARSIRACTGVASASGSSNLENRVQPLVANAVLSATALDDLATLHDNMTTATAALRKRQR